MSVSRFGLLLGLLGASVVACGGVEPAAQQIAPVGASSGDDEQLPPPTTVPQAIDALTCAESPITIAERTLIARRQRTPSPGCLADSATGVAEASSAEVCWDRCTDGRVFVDFRMDTTAPVDGITPVQVRYVADYRDVRGEVSTQAEILTFASGVPTTGRWAVTATTAIDLSEPVAATRVAVDRYLDALARQDYDAAAASTVGAGASRDDPERPDLGRLVDEGLLDDDSVAGVAVALARWCQRADCRYPDELRSEITPSHEVRFVAVYHSGSAAFDVPFRVDSGTLPMRVVGLPPELP